MTKKKPTLDELVELSKENVSSEFISLVAGEEVSAIYNGYDVEFNFRPEENDPDFMQNWKDETVVVFKFEIDGIQKIFQRKTGNATADFSRVLNHSNTGDKVTIGKKPGSMGAYYINLG